MCCPLLGEAKTARNRLVEQAFLKLALRQGLWKFIPSVEPLLFDLKEDLGETHNVAEQHPQVLQDSKERLNAIRHKSDSQP